MNLKNISSEVRKKIIEISFKSGSSHVGSNLSIVEILVTIYYFFIKKNKSEFILSKGHAALSLYCVLGKFKFIDNNLLEKYGTNYTKLMSHVSHKVNGVTFSTGSLGHGLPYASGRAYINKKKKYYVLLSDGELNEGSNWEALLFIGHHKLTNLILIIDYNKIQSFGFVKNILRIEPIKKKFLAFGFFVSEIDGHNINKIFKVLKKKTTLPHVIIAHTTKGKGVSFMENKLLWHYKSPNRDEFLNAIKEIE